jgi:outer membrane receptor protein involved in Fe transport
MRILFSLAALLPLAAYGADQDVSEPGAMEESGPNDVVVTGMRDPRSASRTPASVSRIDEETLAEIAPRHQADVLNTSPGVYVQRGSGSESLGAIRSPVLTGAGACGAFLMAEDSLPIRPVGFCNLNEMFELNYEQAAVVEVLRGPGSALFGASAVHGIVNVLTPNVSALPALSLGAELGSDSFRRIDFAAGTQEFYNHGIGAYGTWTRAPGWRDSSGVDEAKLNLLADGELGNGHLRVRAAGTVLNQETAGFIQGYESYRDEDIAKSNPNPEAYRDASSARVAVHWDAGDTFGKGSELSVAALYRRSRMDFIQHFLIGKPFEHNAQTSYLLSGMATFPFDALTARVALDAETASSELSEFQPGPATDGTPPQNAIRPAGLHYDYHVDSWTLGATASLEYRISDEFTATAALRVDETNYDYDNLMIDGNTAENGVPCPGAGCLYSRPADRSDTFDNLAPRVTLGWQPNAENLVYLNGSTGFRPPEMTEMYRLQRQQTAANLDSEELESVELGWKFRSVGMSLDLAVFTMNKDNVILRETNGFNVSNGSTRHRGLEYQLDLHPRLGDVRLTATFAGTFARHEYTFSRAVEGGETIVAGNDVDTAPRNVHSFNLEVPLGHVDEWKLGLTTFYVGSYYLDAANTARYSGHNATNVRVAWNKPGDFRFALHLDNVFDQAYADRADFAFGNYRYFPARGRALFLSAEFRRH